MAWLHPQPLGGGPLAWHSTDCDGRSCDRGRMRPLWQRCEAGEASARDGFGSGRPEARRTKGVGEVEEPDPRTPCEEVARYDQGYRTEAHRSGGRRDRGQPARSGSACVAVPRAFEPPYGLNTSGRGRPLPVRKRSPQPPGQGSSPTRPPLTDLLLPTMPVGNALKETRAT